MVTAMDSSYVSTVINNIVIDEGTGSGAFKPNSQTGVTWKNNAYLGGSLPPGVATSGGFTVASASYLFLSIQFDFVSDVILSC